MLSNDKIGRRKAGNEEARATARLTTHEMRSDPPPTSQLPVELFGPAPKHPDPGKRWLAFLRNHREAIAAMDFFTVPTLTFGVLYCFFVIGHDRRKILHFNVTRIPMVSGLSSNCEKRGPTNSHTDS